MEKDNNYYDKLLEIYIKNWHIVASILGFSCVLLSSVYYFGYFKQLHIPIGILPLNINDLLISAIMWVPTAISIFTGYIFYGIIKLRFAKKSTFINPNINENTKYTITNGKIKTIRIISFIFL